MPRAFYFLERRPRMTDSALPSIASAESGHRKKLLPTAAERDFRPAPKRRNQQAPSFQRLPVAEATWTVRTPCPYQSATRSVFQCAWLWQRGAAFPAGSCALPVAPLVTGEEKARPDQA